MPQVSIYLSEEKRDEIDDRAGTDSRSGWIKHAIQSRLDRPPLERRVDEIERRLDEHDDRILELEPDDEDGSLFDVLR